MDETDEKRCPECGSEYTHLNRRLGQWECEDCGYSFEGDEENDDENRLTLSDLYGKTEHPVKIFLSYPHSSREICVMIRDALRRRGHEVWFDEEEIRAGDDWRTKIAEGIDGSKSVVSCLTRDAVRMEGNARGVCLDELSIALSTPGCVVQSVLLEPADVVEPTAAIAHRQWLDMSDWKRMRDERPEEFGPWLDRMMLELLAVVEDEESRTFAGEVEEVHDLLPLADRHMGSEKLLSKLFVGREWLAKEVDAWAEDPEGGALCALWGDPGVGKSAFAAHYALRNPRVAASVRLAHDNDRYNSIDAIAQSVAYQLAIRLPDYRKELLRSLRGERVGAMGPAELVDLLFARPLVYRHIDGKHEHLCVLVDGLDECGTEAGKAVSLVRSLRDALPHWLRLLVLSRREPDVVAALHPDDELWLRGSGDRNMADVEEYLMRGLEDAVPDEDRRRGAASELATRSNGVFLFAEAVLGAVGEGMDPLDASSYPQTLDESLHGWFERLFPDKKEYRDKFRLPIGAMLASPAPLPEEEFNRLLGMSGAEASDLLMCMGTLLSRGEDDFEKRTVAIAHRYVADWLDSKGAGRFRTPTSDGLRALAVGCYSVAASDPDELSGYEAAYAIPLAHAAGMKAELQELERCRGLASRLLNLGDQLSSQGGFESAKTLVDQALAINDLRAKELGMSEAQQDLSMSLEWAGDLAYVRGDLGATMGYYQRSLELDEWLAKKLGTPDSLRDLSVSLGRVGDMARELGNPTDAEKHYKKSLELREQLVKEHNDSDSLRDLAHALERVGDVTRAIGDLEAAKAHYQRALALRETLLGELGRPVERRCLSVTLEKIGHLARMDGDLDAAEGFYARSLELREELAGELDTPSSRRYLAVSLASSGDLARDRGNLDAAEKRYARCLELLEWLDNEYETPGTRQDLSVSLQRIGILAHERGDLKTSEEYFQRALELREQLAEELDTPNAYHDLASALNNTGLIAMKRGDLKTAEEFQERALTLFTRLCNEHGTLETRRGLVAILDNMGDLSQKCDDLAAAEEHYMGALDLQEQIAEELGTPNMRQFLARLLSKAGDVALERGDREAAKERYSLAVKILGALANELGERQYKAGLEKAQVKLASVIGAQSPATARL